jgi:hypothetical protein
MPEHVSGVRKNGAHQKIEKKIEVLEHYAADPVVAKKATFIPKDLVSFREWEDKNLGLERIGSPNTMDRPYNKGLKKQALELINRLAKKKVRKERRTEVIATLRAQLRNADRLTRELTNQVHTTRHELDQARQSEKRWKARADEYSQEIAELLQKLSKVTVLKPVNRTTQETSHDVQ